MKSLRKVLCDRELMILHGFKLIKALIYANDDLEKYKVRIRSICPHTTWVSTDYDKV